MPNPLGHGQGPAAPAHPAQRYLTSDAVRKRVEELVALHSVEMEKLESPVERVKAGLMIAGPFLEMLTVPLSLVDPAAGKLLGDVLKRIEEKANNA